jgi:membrane protease YdiL (CAAX protease family)
MGIRSYRRLGRVLCHAVLLFALTAPLWLWSGHTGLVAPGLPLAAAGVVCPALAAWIVARAADGPDGVATWWSHARPVASRLPGRVLLLSGALPVGATLISLMWQGTAARTEGLPFVALLAFTPVALAGAWLEEAGWSALATETLRPAWPLVPAALVIGVIWAVWHLIPLVQVGRSPAWIAWWVVGTLAMRVTLIWLYERGGHHVCAPALFHAVDNLCWQGQMTLGFEFDPRTHGVLMTAIAALVMAVNRRTVGRSRAIPGQATGRPTESPAGRRSST